MTESQIEEGKQASVLFLAMDLLFQSTISCVSILPLTAALTIASLPDPQYPPPSAVLSSHKGIHSATRSCAHYYSHSNSR
jgi:hypothetical protein